MTVSPSTRVAVGEDDVAEEAGQFIRGRRLHDRLVRAGQDFAGIVPVQQQRAQAVARLLIRPMVDAQPAPFGQNRLRARADADRVPQPGPGPGQALVPPPVDQIG